ncbi:MAG: signal peptidase I [Thermodesulfobacteriota bacterium]
MSGFFLSSKTDADKSFLRQNLESVLLALLLALCVRAFIVQPFKIPSSSMEPTLLVGDYIIVQKFAYETKIPFFDIAVYKNADVKKGDIVVFKKSDNPGGKKNYFIKRVIATGGDIVEIRGRVIYINGDKTVQSYAGMYEEEDGLERYEQRFGTKNVSVIYEKGRYSTYKGNVSYPLIVPEGQVFLMGDNRDNSRDSRLWGTISESEVVGKAVMIHWSWSFKDSLVPEIRWKRIFSGIR